MIKQQNHEKQAQKNERIMKEKGLHKSASIRYRIKNPFRMKKEMTLQNLCKTNFLQILPWWVWSIVQDKSKSYWWNKVVDQLSNLLKKWLKNKTKRNNLRIQRLTKERRPNARRTKSQNRIRRKLKNNYNSKRIKLKHNQILSQSYRKLV